MVSVPNLSTKVEVSFAQNPVGPWTAPQVIYQGPSQTSVLNYDAFVHRETKNNGVYTISYSINGTTGGLTRQLNDRTVYTPYYIKANLLLLSPYTVAQEEAESLTVPNYSGPDYRVIGDPGFSGGEAVILDSTAAGNYITFLVPNVGAGTYDVRVGVKRLDTRGTWQLAVGRADNFTGTKANVGPVVDDYSSSAEFVEVDLGNWSPGTTSDKWFRFSITGKNASSTGYTECFDYIQLIAQ
jgi:hypothetical protein